VEYRRAFSGAPASVDAQDPIAVGIFPGHVSHAARLRLDRTTLASSRELEQELSAEPNVVGYTFNEQNQPILFNASTTRGLTMEAMNQSVGTIGLSSLDAARVRQDIEAGGVVPNLGAKFETPFGVPPGPGLDRGPNGAAVPGESAPPNLPPNLLQASVGSDYNRILQRIANRYATATVSDDLVDTEVGTEVSTKLNKEYNALRDQLARPTGRELDPRRQAVAQRGDDLPGDVVPGGRRTLTSPTESSDDRARADARASDDRASRRGDLPGAAQPEEPFAARPDRATEGPGIDAQGIVPGSEDRDRQPPRAPEDFGVFLRHGERVERLSAPSQDRFNELMASAEQKLREGDYFWAERRFERALRFVPGHPMAMVGAAHAQLGGGLYLSASLSLRNLFTNQPEMIDVIYAPELLPNRQRLDEAVTGLRRRLEGPVDHAAYAFLLAYIGHQIADRALVEEGLDVMGKADPENPLTALLRSIWLAPPEGADAEPEVEQGIQK
ncbi:MAG: hypothetical protein L0219_02940, partial [Phycisphaerales bacterium]|nr:hypothetical protein [Phycisphaerales bacterium]